MKKRQPPKSFIVESRFNYTLLKKDDAGRARAAAERIREKLKRSLENMIDMGVELTKVKALLDHGSFRAWLQAEFDWSLRTAQHLMSVAEQFGPKSAIIAHLAIQPTAAYLLASPSVPEQARQMAISKAESGEHITAKEARKLIGQFRLKESNEKGKHEQDTSTTHTHLQETLEEYRIKCQPDHWAVMITLLRKFADGMDAIMKTELNKNGTHATNGISARP